MEYWKQISRDDNRVVIQNIESGQYFAWTKQYGWYRIDSVY